MDYVQQLQEQFPGVWIRADGAFITEDRGIMWRPGDMESWIDQVSDQCEDKSGLIRIGPNEITGRPQRLRLSQLVALINYITNVASREREGAA